MNKPQLPADGNMRPVGYARVRTGVVCQRPRAANRGGWCRCRVHRVLRMARGLVERALGDLRRAATGRADALGHLRGRGGATPEMGRAAFAGPAGDTVAAGLCGSPGVRVHSAFAVSADSSTSSVSPGPVSATQPPPDFTTVNPGRLGVLGHPVQPAPAVGVVVAAPLRAQRLVHQTVAVSLHIPRESRHRRSLPPLWAPGQQRVIRTAASPGTSAMRSPPGVRRTFGGLLSRARPA